MLDSAWAKVYEAQLTGGYASAADESPTKNDKWLRIPATYRESATPVILTEGERKGLNARIKKFDLIFALPKW